MLGYGEHWINVTWSRSCSDKNMSQRESPFWDRHLGEVVYSAFALEFSLAFQCLLAQANICVRELPLAPVRLVPLHLRCHLVLCHRRIAQRRRHRGDAQIDFSLFFYNGVEVS